MRLAVSSDVHANLPALEAVLADVASTGVDARYALGDLVGYAPWPNEVLERLRVEGIASVMGDYDDGTGFDREERGCAYRDPVDKALGDRTFAWTKAHVSVNRPRSGGGSADLDTGRRIDGDLKGMVGGLELGRRQESAGLVEPLVVPPVDQGGGLELDLLDAAPGSAPPDELGLVELVDRLGEDVEAPIVVKGPIQAEPPGGVLAGDRPRPPVRRSVSGSE